MRGARLRKDDRKQEPEADRQTASLGGLALVLYQFSQCLTDVCPVATSDGEDFPWLGDEGIPGVAAVIESVVEGFENAVRERVLAHELPDVFLRVDLRRTRRQWQERDIL